MKSNLLTYAAAAALAGALAPTAHAADDQTPAEPAGTVYNPEPVLMEELVYLRDIIALQTLRLDEAEQALVRQNRLIEAQEAKISALEQAVEQTRQTATLAAQQFGGGYVVQSGDTLGAIATRYGTTVGALASANSLAAPYVLSVGQRIVVPGAASQPVAVAQAPAPEPAPTVTEKKITQAPQEEKKPEPKQVAAVDSGIQPTARPDVTERAVREQRKRDDEKQPEGVEEVGIRPEDEDERPYLSILTDVGGILTPRGTMYVEPSTSFSVTSDNRFFFQGIEIIDAILIGAIEATDSDRRAFNESLALRYGLTNRLEIDGRISYVSRDDRITGVAIDDATSVTRELSGNGIGDAEFGLHYQLNNGRKFPYTVLNVRAKAPTGTGPFEVARDLSNGVESELPTGSGYWTVEPSLTFILPSDPAVIFGNFGYQTNLKSNPDAIITVDALGAPTQIIREIDAGDAIRTSIGVGLSVNDRTSLNFGYDQSHILRTTSLIETPTGLVSTTQPSTTIGSFLFGASHAISDRVRLNLNTAIGATDEAPDVSVSLRAQIRLFD